jgi:4-amino-4-deoxy-L-arabinose transferase-like glycosyltransferase
VDEPTPPRSAPSFSRHRDWANALSGRASLVLVLEIALGLRVLAAGLVDFLVRRNGSDQLCLFPDTRYYWALGRMIRSAATSEIVEWSDIPHFALRTPGYPLFLAACQAVFGERTLPVRLVQAVLGTVSVYLVYRLARQFVARSESAAPSKSAPLRWTAPMVAALIAAVGPYYLATPSLILSEAVFEPLMLTALLGLALLWNEPSPHAQSLPSNRKAWLIALLIALGSGAAAGAAILVRPSWALFVPVVLMIWVVLKMGDQRARAVAIRGALVYTLGVVIMITPWCYRNVGIYGRFIPTALWMGASLYDGINPKATGTSDMSFLNDRDIWPLDEQDQDAELTLRAAAFAREQPVCVARLAVIKLARFSSPWPNADNLRSPALLVAAAVVELPFFGLMAVGAWSRRREPRTFVLLIGPALYFCALHLVFASSMRYRIPGQMPAIGLAAIGWMTLIAGIKPRESAFR